MDLSLIQKDILITLISLYHQYSHPIKGEEIAEIIRRNPGTVRNQMQTLKVLGLTDGVPGPKGGYHPTARAYSELNLSSESTNIDVPISRNGTICEGIRVNEIAFTTLTHADLCHALIKIIGNVHAFEIGDNITIGPTPVNKLLIKGEIFGKDEVSSSLLISTTEMTSLPKKPIHEYMTTPLISLESDMTLAYAATAEDTIPINGYLVRQRSGRSGMTYRSLCMVYPTTDGVIETLALTGLDSAIKDVRYMSLFRRLLRERPNAAAQKWLDAVDFTTVPLGKLRRELVDWILRVR